MAVIEAEIVNNRTIQKRSISARQKRLIFARNWVRNGRNGIKAAIAAGYSGGYQSLGAAACRLLKNDQVLAEIARLTAGDSELAIADASEVLQRLTQFSRAGIGDVLNEHGTVDLAEARANGSDRLIKKVKFDKDTGAVTEVEIHDAKDATVHMGKFHKLFTDRVETEMADSDVERITTSLFDRLLEMREQRQLGPTGPTDDHDP